MLINKLTKAALFLQVFNRINPVNSLIRTNIATFSWKNNGKEKDYPDSTTKPRIKLTMDQVNLWSILKSKSKIKKSSPIEQTIQLCKKVTGYYNRVNKNEYLKAKDEIFRIVEDLRTMQLGDQPYQTYCNILDFLDVISTIFGKNENASNLRDIVFMKLTQSVNIQKMAFSEQSRIYASLAKNKYPKLQQVTDVILQSLKKVDKTLQSYIIQKIIVGILSRVYLNQKEVQIFKILLLKINQQIKQINPKCIGLAVHLIEQFEIRSALRDKQILLIIDNLQKYLTLFIQNVKLGDQTLLYFLSFNLKTKKSSIIYEQIWKKIINNLNIKSQYSLIMNILTATLQMLNHHKHTKEQKLLIANYIKQSYQDQTIKTIVFANQTAQKILLRLFQEGVIDGQCIDIYNSIVSAPTFTVTWNLLQYYARNQFAFPEKKLEEFLNSSKKKLTKQYILVKAAVIIPAQAKYYPQNEVIEEFSKNQIRLVTEYNWSPQSLEWMVRQISYDPFIMHAFHKEYQDVFFKKIIRNLNESDQKLMLKYYSYVCEMESKHNVKKQMIIKMPKAIIQALIVRQINKRNKGISKLLISTIIYQINSGVVYFNSQMGKNIMQLMFIYSDLIWKENEAAINEYLQLVYIIIKSYSQLNSNVDYFNLALRKLLQGKNKENPKFYNSISYFQLLQCLYNELPTIKLKSKNKKLIKVIQKSLAQLYPQFDSRDSKIINTENLSIPKTPLEIILQQLHQNKATPQELNQIISSVKTLSFSQIEQTIITKFTYKSKTKLQLQILSQYVKDFSFEQSNNRWKIILFSQWKMANIYEISLNKLINQIIDKLPIQDTYYKDHLFLLNLITRSGSIMAKYKKALYNHLSANYHNQKHNTAYLELATKLSLYVDFDIQFVELLLNQMDTNPHNQLKLIAIFQSQIMKKVDNTQQNAFFQIVSSVVNNSLHSIKPSLFLNYFESLSQEGFKNISTKINKISIDKSIIITKRLTLQDRKILEVLSKKDKVVKQRFFKEDLYIFNKFMIIFSSTENPQIARILKTTLKSLYNHHIFIFTRSNKKEIAEFLKMVRIANSSVNLSLSDFITEETKANPN